MIRKLQEDCGVGVVDADDEYTTQLIALCLEAGVLFRVYPTGREALRQSCVDQNALWLISLELPDMNGIDLFEMLRERLQRAPVCLVGRAYRREDELRAYRAGAAMYACRPVELAWLRHSLRQRNDLPRKPLSTLSLDGCGTTAPFERTKETSPFSQ